METETTYPMHVRIMTREDAMSALAADALVIAMAAGVCANRGSRRAATQLQNLLDEWQTQLGEMQAIQAKAIAELVTLDPDWCTVNHGSQGHGTYALCGRGN